MLADFEYVVVFVQMQRFTDPLQLEVLNAMRVPGGKTISEESWQAILNTEVRTSSDEEPQSDPRLRAARG